jgi:predicted phosphodiesterase
MRIAVLADIHANLTAFEAVLADVEKCGGADEIWCAGDIIGYGPDPHECIALLRKVCKVCVAGNHDLAAAGLIDTSDFNPAAAAANRWTAQQLTPEDTDFIKCLPLMVERGDFTIVHGSPRDPVWEYLFSVEEAAKSLDCFRTPYGLVGHTHASCVFKFGRSGKVRMSTPEDGTEIKLGEERLIINPGGVGQPRDSNPRASYGMIDTDCRTFTLRRVPYDIPSVQARMRERGLPETLWRRLAPGSHQVSPLICLFDPEVLPEFSDAARKNRRVLTLFYYGSFWAG